MSENFNVENNQLNKDTRQEKKVLSEKERSEFKNEFDMINSLIEDHFNESELNDSVDQATENKTTEENDENLTMKQSFNDPIKLNQERLQRIGLLKSDRTGKNIKASGEDI